MKQKEVRQKIKSQGEFVGIHNGNCGWGLSFRQTSQSNKVNKNNTNAHENIISYTKDSDLCFHRAYLLYTNSIKIQQNLKIRRKEKLEKFLQDKVRTTY